MTTQEKAIDYLKSIIPKYDFLTGKNHVINGNNVSNLEIVFVFGSNIKAYYNFKMKAFYKIKNRLGDEFGFYWKFEDWANIIDNQLELASTCSICGAKNGLFSDGYFTSDECKKGKPLYYNGCKVVEYNDFSKFISHYSR